MGIGLLYVNLKGPTYNIFIIWHISFLSFWTKKHNTSMLDLGTTLGNRIIQAIFKENGSS